jgi:plastocyanin
MQLTVHTEEDPMGGRGKSGKSGKSGKGSGPGLDWSIRIVAVSPGLAGFKPDVLGAQVGDSLQAQQFDIVTWGNTTSDTHQPIRTDNGQPLCDPIAGGASSRPQFVVQGEIGHTITYTCALHQGEEGSIRIVPNFM